MDIDFSKPKRLGEVNTPDHERAIPEVNAAQPSGDDMQMFFAKLATNSKSIALLSAVPEFCDDFVSIPASEPNVPKCLGDLYDDRNRDLTNEELTALCERVADELVVTRSEALYLEVASSQRAWSGLSTGLDGLRHQLPTRYCTPTKIDRQALSSRNFAAVSIRKSTGSPRLVSAAHTVTSLSTVATSVSPFLLINVIGRRD